MAGAYVLSFTDERDFLRAANALLGEGSVSTQTAMSAINAMPQSERFGEIVADQLLPIPKSLVEDE